MASSSRGSTSTVGGGGGTVRETGMVVALEL
jgi:hypothetical protein